jgi:hypothetical protein
VANTVKHTKGFETLQELELCGHWNNLPRTPRHNQAENLCALCPWIARAG